VTLGRRLFLLSLVASLSVTAVLSIAILLFAEFDDTAGQVIATTALLALASLLALPAGVLLEKERAEALAWAVILATAAGFVVAEVAVWASDEEGTWKLALTLGLVALAGAQAATSTSWRDADDPSPVVWLYWIAIVLSVSLITLITIALWRESGDESGARLMGATAVAAVAATLLQPILRRLQGPRGRQAELVLRVDRAPSDAAVAAAVEALERHGVGAHVVSRPRV
jgi:drug/metabolite transporter (DMT)-like permease